MKNFEKPLEQFSKKELQQQVNQWDPRYGALALYELQRKQQEKNSEQISKMVKETKDLKDITERNERTSKRNTKNSNKIAIIALVVAVIGISFQAYSSVFTTEQLKELNARAEIEIIFSKDEVVFDFTNQGEYSEPTRIYLFALNHGDHIPDLWEAEVHFSSNVQVVDYDVENFISFQSESFSSFRYIGNKILLGGKGNPSVVYANAGSPDSIGWFDVRLASSSLIRRFGVEEQLAWGRIYGEKTSALGYQVLVNNDPANGLNFLHEYCTRFCEDGEMKIFR